MVTDHVKTYSKTKIKSQKTAHKGRA